MYLIFLTSYCSEMDPEQQLHQAVKEKNSSKVEKLLNEGVDINCLFYGWTPLQYSISLGEILFLI